MFVHQELFFLHYHREACSSDTVLDAASAPPQLSSEDAALLLHAPPPTSEATPALEAGVLDVASEVAMDTEVDSDGVVELLPLFDEEFCL